MKMKVQLVIESESGSITTTDIIAIERAADGLIGMSLAEAKAMNASAQRARLSMPRLAMSSPAGRCAPTARRVFGVTVVIGPSIARSSGASS